MTINGLGNEGLSNEELSVLNQLSLAWDEFIDLGNHTGDDENEFRDGIHRAQQIIALRIARRVDPDVWA